ncbi:MAG: hypothetical protein ACXAEN_27415 [Candidatus Thorarchaeota archaeon]
MISLRKKMWKVRMRKTTMPLTRELWSYTKVTVGDLVTFKEGYYNVLSVIEVESPAIQGSFLGVVEDA